MGDRREKLRMAAAAAVGAIVVLLCVLNLDDVQVNWILGTWDTPLIVVIVVSMLAGVGMGFAVARGRLRGRAPKP